MNVEINNSSGGTVIVQDRKERRKWVKRWHAFGLFFSVSNCRMKKRDEREYKDGCKGFRDLKELAFKKQGGAARFAVILSATGKWSATMCCLGGVSLSTG